MKHALGPALVLAGMLAACGASAQFLEFGGPPVGEQAGTVMVRLRAIGVIPEPNSEIDIIGGHLSVTKTAAPEIDLSYFFTDHFAAEVIAGSTRHEVKAEGTALGNLDLGSSWVLPPTVTLQYHFFPHEQFIPYVGAGLNVTFFYDTNPALPTVKKFYLGTGFGPAIQAGFDYNFTGHWFLNVDVKQIFEHNNPVVNHVVKASLWLDPTVVGVGIGYRF
jgi:outer membrane protein